MSNSVETISAKYLSAKKLSGGIRKEYKLTLWQDDVTSAHWTRRRRRCHPVGKIEVGFTLGSSSGIVFQVRIRSASRIAVMRPAMSNGFTRIVVGRICSTFRSC